MVQTIIVSGPLCGGQIKIAAMAGSWPRMPSDGPIELIIEFCPPDNRRRDLDNALASIKAGLDGIANRIGVDDARFRPTIQFGPVVTGGEVRITFAGGV